MLSLNVLVIAFWLGLFPSVFITLPVYRKLHQMKGQNVSKFAPKAHELKQGTPTMGGIIVVVSTFFGICGLISTQLPDRLQPIVPGFWLNAAAFIVASFAGIGFVDDYLVPRLMPGKRGLGWKQKLGLQLLAGAAAAWWMCNGFNIHMAALTILIVLFSNAYNFADGLDMLAGSLLLAFTIGVVGLAMARPTDWTAPLVLTTLTGASIPFLFLNAPPAKLFMGDVGSLPIGALMGACVGMMAKGQISTSLMGQSHRVPVWEFKVEGFDGLMALALSVLSLVMVAELLPVPLQIFWVKVFKKRLFPFTPIHHAFEKAGWKETHVVALFALTQLVLAFAAMTILAFENPHAAISRMP